MVAQATIIQISGLAKDDLAALRKDARRLGLSPEAYARQIIQNAILEKRARTTTFDELFAGAQARFEASKMSEADFDKLVDQARKRNDRGRGRARRRKR